jgi:hypothetical protein
MRLKDKVRGKSPVKCEAELDFGRPLLAVRSKTTGQLAQWYNATGRLDIGRTVYCVLRYDKDDQCEDLDLVDVAASTKARPF